MIAITAENVVLLNSKRERAVPAVPKQNERYERPPRARVNPEHARECRQNLPLKDNFLIFLTSYYHFNP